MWNSDAREFIFQRKFYLHLSLNFLTLLGTQCRSRFGKFPSREVKLGDPLHWELWRKPQEWGFSLASILASTDLSWQVPLPQPAAAGKQWRHDWKAPTPFFSGFADLGAPKAEREWVGGGRPQRLASGRGVLRRKPGRPEAPRAESRTRRPPPGLEARKWVCAWGAAKLPVPRSSCFRQEPEDAVCGRNSGPIDPRADAGDVRWAPGRAGPHLLGRVVPESEGASTSSSGARAQGALGGDRETAPLGTPAGPGGPGSGRSEAPRLGPFPARDLGADVSAPSLAFGGRGVGTRPSRESRSQRVPWAGAPGLHWQRGLPADLGPTPRPSSWGNVRPEGLRPGCRIPALPLLSCVPFLSGSGRRKADRSEGLACGFCFACHSKAGVGCVHRLRAFRRLNWSSVVSPNNRYDELIKVCCTCSWDSEMHLGTIWRLNTINLRPKNLHYFLTLVKGRSIFSKRIKETLWNKVRDILLLRPTLCYFSVDSIKSTKLAKDLGSSF